MRKPFLPRVNSFLLELTPIKKESKHENASPVSEAIHFKIQNELRHKYRVACHRLCNMCRKRILLLGPYADFEKGLLGGGA